MSFEGPFGRPKPKSHASEMAAVNPENTAEVASYRVFGDRLRGFEKYIKGAVAAGMLFAQGTAVAEQVHSTPDPSTRVERVMEDLGAKADSFVDSLGGRLHVTDASGNIERNNWAYMAPVQFEGSFNTHEIKSVVIKVPYRYSRAFDTGAAVNPEERENASKFIEAEMRKVFAEKVYGLTDTSKDVYRMHHPLQTGHISVQSVTIDGLASPEGHAKKGSDSIKIGAVDQENIALAQKRAGDMEPAVHDALSTFGISEQAIQSVTGHEAQFSEAELHTLALEAQKNGISNAVDDVEAAYLLITSYNGGEEITPETKKVLDNIVGSKRSVDVTITYNQTQKNTLAVPIPLLLLLGGLPFLRRNKRRKEYTRTVDSQGQGGPGPIVRERFSARTEFDYGNDRKTLEGQIPSSADDERFINVYNTAKNSVEAKAERRNISKRLLIDEINPYLGTKRDDIGYMDLVMLNCDKAQGNEVQGTLIPLTEEQQEDLKRRIAYDVLERWEINDKTVRAQYGQDVTQENRYWQDGQKVLWAQETAEHLFHYITIMNSGRSPITLGENTMEYRNNQRKIIAKDFPKISELVYKEIAKQMRDAEAEDRLVPEREEIRTGAKMHSHPRSYREYGNRDPIDLPESV